MTPEQKEALLKRQREWYAAMPPEQKEAFLEKKAEWYATMPPEQKEALLESSRKGMEAGTLARAAAVPMLPGEFLAGDRLCIFGCGRPANAEQCRACPHCCLLP